MIGQAQVRQPQKAAATHRHPVRGERSRRAAEEPVRQKERGDRE